MAKSFLEAWLCAVLGDPLENLTDNAGRFGGVLVAQERHQPSLGISQDGSSGIGGEHVRSNQSVNKGD